MNTIEMASLSFGKNGTNILVGLIIGISTLGWFGVLTGIVRGAFLKNNVRLGDTDIGWVIRYVMGYNNDMDFRTRIQVLEMVKPDSHSRYPFIDGL